MEMKEILHVFPFKGWFMSGIHSLCYKGEMMKEGAPHLFYITRIAVLRLTYVTN